MKCYVNGVDFDLDKITNRSHKFGSPVRNRQTFPYNLIISDQELIDNLKEEFDDLMEECKSDDEEGLEDYNLPAATESGYPNMDELLSNKRSYFEEIFIGILDYMLMLKLFSSNGEKDGLFVLSDVTSVDDLGDSYQINGNGFFIDK